MVAKTSTEKSQERRARLDKEGLSELRNIYANKSERVILTKLCNDKLIELRGNK